MKITKLITIFGLAFLAITAMAATKLVTVDDTQTYPWDVERDYVLADRIPIGTILSYSSVTAPSGYFLCDGSAVSRSTYSNLFSVISTNFGVGDGSTTFTLPDLRNRFALGVSSGLGAVGGTNQVTLTVAQMPKHLHNLHFGLGGTGTIADPLPNQTHAYGSSYTNMDQMGGDAAHTNMPPYQTVCYIIKHSDVILTTANNALRTDGTIPMTGTLETPNIKITSGATNGAVWVATNSLGQGKWSFGVPQRGVVFASASVVQSNALGVYAVNFKTVDRDPDGCWDGTNKYTAKWSGYYTIKAAIQNDQKTTSYMALYTNSAIAIIEYASIGGANDYHAQLSTDIYLSSGDSFQIFYGIGTGYAWLNGNPQYCWIRVRYLGP